MEHLITGSSEARVGRHFKSCIRIPKPDAPDTVYAKRTRAWFSGDWHAVEPNPTGILTELITNKEYVFQVSYIFRRNPISLKAVPVCPLSDWKPELANPYFFDHMPIEPGLRMFIEVAEFFSQGGYAGMPKFFVPGKADMEGIVLPYPGQQLSQGQKFWALIKNVYPYQSSSGLRTRLVTYRIRKDMEPGSELSVIVNEPRVIQHHGQALDVYKCFFPGYDFFIDSRGKQLEDRSIVQARVESVGEPRYQINRPRLDDPYLAFEVKRPKVIAVVI